MRPEKPELIKIYPIVLAAGASRRFGANKLLFPLEGKPMVLHVLEKLLQLSEAERKREAQGGDDGRIQVMEPTVVVSRQETAEKLEELPVKLVWNRRSEEGISTSLRAGLEAVIRRREEETSGTEEWICAFFVADQPYLRTETLERLFLEFPSCGKGMGCLACEGRRGNPVLFWSRYVPELLELTGDSGGKQLFRRYPEDICEIETDDPGELEDVDYRPEAENLKEKTIQIYHREVADE
jgi:molybdenum cofactor cytidylyltransferase